MEEYVQKIKNLMSLSDNSQVHRHLSEAWHQLIKPQNNDITNRRISIDIIADQLLRASRVDGVDGEIKQEIIQVRAELARLMGLRDIGELS